MMTNIERGVVVVFVTLVTLVLLLVAQGTISPLLGHASNRRLLPAPANVSSPPVTIPAAAPPR
jgi:hypothetical protein